MYLPDVFQSDSLARLVNDAESEEDLSTVPPPLQLIIASNKEISTKLLTSLDSYAILWTNGGFWQSSILLLICNVSFFAWKHLARHPTVWLRNAPQPQEFFLHLVGERKEDGSYHYFKNSFDHKYPCLRTEDVLWHDTKRSATPSQMLHQSSPEYQHSNDRVTLWKYSSFPSR